jgi:uncharacterized metal-binding protein
MELSQQIVGTIISIAVLGSLLALYVKVASELIKRRERKEAQYEVEI